MEGFEQLTDDVLRLLAASTEEQLLQAAAELKLTEGDVEKAKSKGRGELKRVIRRFLDGDELEEAEDGGKSVWQGLFTVLGKGDNGSVKQVVEAEAEVQHTEPPMEPVKPRPTATKSPPESQVKVEDVGAHVRASPPIPTSTPAFTWRKEFRIQGQIGEPGQKDRLSYASLARQIHAGQRKGIPEDEILEAVVRAIVPGIPLRSYLEDLHGSTSVASHSEVAFPGARCHVSFSTTLNCSPGPQGSGA